MTRMLSVLAVLLACCCAQGGGSLCTVASCSEAKSAALTRLPGACVVSVPQCQAELARQKEAIRPVDGEEVFLQRFDGMNGAILDCGRRNSGNFSNFVCRDRFQVDSDRVAAARTPGDFGFVFAQAFNLSISRDLRPEYKRRMAYCNRREQMHMQNAISACANNANCVNVFNARLAELDGFLRIIRLELFGLRWANVPYDAAAIVQRPCVASVVPFAMCELELFSAWTSNQTVDRADLDLQIAAVEPTDSASPYFLRLRAIYGSPRDMCFLSRCPQVTGTLEGLQFEFERQNPTGVITTANAETVGAAYGSCWKGCFVVFQLYIRSKLAVLQRELQKVDRMRELQLLCPDDGGACVAMLEQECVVRWRSQNLASVDVKGSFAQLTVPCDKADALVGLVLSCCAFAASVVLLVLSIKWRSELRFIFVLLIAVAAWTVLRIVFWVSFHYVGYDPPFIPDVFFAGSFTLSQTDPVRLKQLVLTAWLEGIIFISQAVIFALVLLYWLEALALLRNWNKQVAKAQSIGLVIFLALFICATLACLGYITHSLLNDSTLENRNTILLVGKLFSAALVLIILLDVAACVCCILGILIFLQRKEKTNAAAVVKSLLLYLVILFALATRGTFWFDNGYAVISVDQFGWNFFFATVLADALIIASLLVFSGLAIYARFASTNGGGDGGVAMESTRRPLLEDDHVPAQYSI